MGIGGLTFDAKSSRSFPLWFGTLAPPLAWGAQLILGDLIYELGCASGFATRNILGLSFELWVVVVTSVMAAVTIVAGSLSIRAFREIRRAESEPASGSDVRIGRAKDMAIAGMAESALFLALILYGFTPPLFLSGCTASL